MVLSFSLESTLGALDSNGLKWSLSFQGWGGGSLGGISGQHGQQSWPGLMSCKHPGCGHHLNNCDGATFRQLPRILPVEFHHFPERVLGGPPSVRNWPGTNTNPSIGGSKIASTTYVLSTGDQLPLLTSPFQAFPFHCNVWQLPSAPLRDLTHCGLLIPVSSLLMWLVWT